MLFKKLNGTAVNVVDYAVMVTCQDPKVRIYIGTDSQNTSRRTTMATVIAFRYSNSRGVHVIYSKTVMPKIKNVGARLRKEVEKTIMTANWLSDNTILKFEKVEFDLNKDPKFESHNCVNEASGWAIGMGYSVAYKPDELVACRAANELCR